MVAEPAIRRAGAEALQLQQRMVAHRALSIGGAFQRGIVMQYDLVITREMQVGFQRVGAL